jgi:hypothetical protein
VVACSHQARLKALPPFLSFDGFLLERLRAGVIRVQSQQLMRDLNGHVVLLCLQMAARLC